jgi:ABC-type dipeptide/oligopeptide/nickel transport system permease component
MIAYIVRRILIALPVLWGVLTLVFVAVHLLPGDPAEVMLAGSGTVRDVARLRHELGLDLPLPVQYGTFLTHAVRLDFGRSIVSNQPVFRAIFDRFPSTLTLVLLAMAIATVVGVSMGIAAALSQRTLLGLGITASAVLGISVPDFWLGTMLALIFGVKLGWLPVAGAGDLWHLVLPALTLATGVSAVVMRLVRASLVDALHAHYVRTARAKGLRRSLVVCKHALKNALIPVVTVLGLVAAQLLGGVVIIETVFALPGVGQLAVSAVVARDFPVVEGLVFFVAVLVIGANLVVDVAYVVLDPRIQYT